jgi:hypothetical protein
MGILTSREPFGIAVLVSDSGHFALLLSLDRKKELPASTEERLLFWLPVYPRDDTPAGTLISLTLTDGPDGDGVGPNRFRNDLPYRGETTYQAISPGRLVSGAVHVTRSFSRGDSNADGNQLDLGDGVYILQYLFRSGPEPLCLDAADVNDQGGVNMSDAVYVLQHLFADGPAPPPPFASCGGDETDDELDCRLFPPCD